MNWIIANKGSILAIASSVCFIISEILAYTPGPAGGIVQAIQQFLQSMGAPKQPEIVVPPPPPPSNSAKN